MGAEEPGEPEAGEQGAEEPGARKPIDDGAGKPRRSREPESRGVRESGS